MKSIKSLCFAVSDSVIAITSATAQLAVSCGSRLRVPDMNGGDQALAKEVPVVASSLACCTTIYFLGLEVLS